MFALTDVPARPVRQLPDALPMRDLIEEILNGLAAPFYFGQILVTKREGAGFVLLHRDDASLDRLQTYRERERRRSKSQSTMTRETIVRSKQRRTCGMAGGWSSLPSKN